MSSAKVHRPNRQGVFCCDQSPSQKQKAFRIRIDLQVHFPASLTAQQRAALHSAAEEAGISHASSGEGAARHITLGDTSQPQVQVEDVGRTSNAQLCELLRQHFAISAEPFFASSRGHTPENGQAADRRSAVRRSAGRGQLDAALTLSSFVASTLPLLDLERDAEIAQVCTSAISIWTRERRGLLKSEGSGQSWLSSLAVVPYEQIWSSLGTLRAIQATRPHC